jgi:UDPglucose 6-dehydrogenase
MLSAAKHPSPSPIGTVGLSHLGIVTSAGWASLGLEVVAVDPEPGLAARLAAGQLPIAEPGLPDLLARSRDSIRFSADFAELAACELVVVARDVPTDQHNVADVRPVEALVDAAVPHLRQGVVLVVMSQVSPGFSAALVERIQALRPELRFHLHYLVETLIFGDAVRRCLEPERFIVGCADPSAGVHTKLAAVLGRFGCPILPMRYESAELTKTAINLYLIGSVTYANTLADLCEEIGADWGEIAPALRLDRRIGPHAYLRPGLGVAGGNLERDLVALRGLAAAHDVDATYLDALAEHNAARFDWVRRQLERRVFAEVANPCIAVWGLAYKRDTDSTRNSPALRLMRGLEGRATVRAWDPLVRAVDLSDGACLAESAEAALDGAVCLAIMTDWPHFAEADLSTLRHRMRRPLVVDTVGALTGRLGELNGIEHVAMGR